jgi:hypothetical protein
MTKQSLEDWQAEMKKRFSSSDEVAFICPACGRVATIKEHIDAGGTRDNAPQQCIGRTSGLGTKNQTDKGNGCNWAAFGLFGAMGKGRQIVFPDNSSTEVFDFGKEETCDSTDR